ncbi:MAG TPA: hypothetical protein VFX70_13895 [Mycobacteriales bacterium]|nr:hypothetical protein [Mycobacteriales bacterium]
MLATTTSSGERVADAGTDNAAEAVDEEFWALVCGDEELLSAEFDAIVAAEWPSPPVHSPGRSADHGRPGGPAHEPTHGLHPRARPAHPGVDGWSRQRSPPHAE